MKNNTMYTKEEIRLMRLADLYNLNHLLEWDVKILEDRINKISDINIKVQIQNAKNTVRIPSKQIYLRYLK